ncbi:hypothetical protein CF15_06965 [Pyrodictium occultum]|uniref:Uncharacterized protein n=2 Tax=Pyrodictium occultum TaxID=2309 RepID=A0A0V8RWX1_PYROC|nr:hypothetical protein CF15_06965 [Pyrodictium occultum]
MRYTSLALAGLVASAAALALLAGFATTQSPLSSFYAVGGAQAPNEPVTITSNLSGISPAAGAQGDADIGTVTVKAGSNVNVVKIRATLANAEQLKKYFDYLEITIANDNGEAKAMVSLEKPSAVIVLDQNDIGGDNQATLSFHAYYEVKEGMLFDSMPVIFNFQVLSTS